jgi:Raf kinase inhibitor-like YbhB/YbcL family protein
MDGIVLSSAQFTDGGGIPLSMAHLSVGGENRSPQLVWGDLPPSTRSLAITCWDPDAPTTVGFSHWVRFDIPSSRTEMPEGAGTEAGDWVDGFTDFGESHYGGMAPPPGDDPHRYQFTLYALDVPSLELGATTTYARFRFASRAHVLATGTLTGRFGLPKDSGR